MSGVGFEVVYKLAKVTAGVLQPFLIHQRAKLAAATARCKQLKVYDYAPVPDVERIAATAKGNGRDRCLR